MKKLLTISACILFGLNVQAQRDKESDDLQKNLKPTVKAEKEGWTKAGILNIGLNQAMLENWAAGGERMSMSINGQFNGSATRTKGNTMWNNTLDLFYGLNYISSNDFVPRKLDDRIDFSSRYGWQPRKWTAAKNKFKKFTYLTGLFRFQSQFTPGYNYGVNGWELSPISEFMSPAYFTLALGAEYKPSDKFSIFYSPFAARLTTVKSKYTRFGPAFGVKQGETTRFELGSYLTARYMTNITSNILYTTRLDLYSNYLAKSYTDANGPHPDSPGNIDVLWDNFFAIKLSKFIGAGVGFTMIYDNDVPGQKTKSSNIGGVDVPNSAYGPLGWTQLKQVLNIGFSYKL